MAETQGGGMPPTSSAASPSPATAAPAGATAAYKAASPNPALRMMGIPGLPKKLPSRNWMIFWAISLSFSAAIIYDKREKKRATTRWSKAVAHLAKEPLTNPSQLPRRLTVFLESPPGDGLRVCQDHFVEYVKPILAASGLDWDYIQGRREGDVRAALAERIRRTRDQSEQPGIAETMLPENREPTKDEIINYVRATKGTPQWKGMNGDIVIGRHTWKEYVRAVHEGWLGPKNMPAHLEAETSEKQDENEDNKEKEKETEKNRLEKPFQPQPYNTTNDYPASALPRYIPTDFSPSVAIPFPHVLGFSSTFTRLGRFLNRRHLADEIGREVAAACLAAAREFKEETGIDPHAEYEQQMALAHEERDWPKSLWEEKKPEQSPEASEKATVAEKIWSQPVVLDSRIAMRMRRFELQPEDEARARAIVVPEEEVEGWIKGSIRSLCRWVVSGSPRPSSWSDD